MDIHGIIQILSATSLVSYIFNHFLSSTVHFAIGICFKYGGMKNGNALGDVMIFAPSCGSSSNIPFSFRYFKPVSVDVQQTSEKLVH